MIWIFHNCMGKNKSYNIFPLCTLKYDCVIKTTEMFNFLSVMNNSVTTGFSFLLLIMSAIMSSKTINILHFLFICILQYFYKHIADRLNIQ